MEIKTVQMVTAEGKRNVKVANAIRSQAFSKLTDLLADAGFAPVKAANGDLAFPLVQDEHTGETYYIRLAVSLSNKDLESKTERKAKEKAPDVAIPELF